ncbi:MAG: MBL fold metallo-hydrolase [Gordonibacter sp.]|uniref:MBL fold metallo-hydrolase n=1 Tax=Gordonibacter sp. TaxID=1968902 RepID=UPI002FC6BF8C
MECNQTNNTQPHESFALDAFSAKQTCLAAPFGVPVELFPNLYIVRVPLPHNPLKAINSYFILAEDKTVIIDVGFNHPACEEALDQALSALGRSWEGVEIVLTHSHPDHTGNLDRIYRDGMPVFANLHSFQEVENLQDMEAHVFGPLLLQAAAPHQSGITFKKGKPRLHVSAELLPLKNQPTVAYLREGDEYRAGDYLFRIVETPGHDPWHICLYEPARKIMIVGDHVLERITPSVASWFPAYNALEEFLASLGKMLSFDVDYVLPAHGAFFQDLQGRVMQLIEHHEERLSEIYGLVASGHHDIVDISSHAKWRYGNWREWELDQKYFSLGETMAHLIYLVCEGKLKQTICGDDYRFELP